MIRKAAVLTLIAAFVSATTPGFACTGISLKAQDGAAIRGRTLEFGFHMQSNVLVIARRQGDERHAARRRQRASSTPRATPLSAPTRSRLPAILDGLNDQGLSVGLFYFPNYAKYTDVTPENANHAIAPQEFGMWVLANFATVDEVKEGVKSIVVVPTPAPGLGSPQGAVAGAHFFVQDRSGKSIAIEPVDGTLKVHDAPLGIMTNAPTYDWHMTNLQNYVNLSVKDVEGAKLGPVTLAGLRLGLRPARHARRLHRPRRFVRAAIYSQSAAPNATAEDAVLSPSTSWISSTSRKARCRTRPSAARWTRSPNGRASPISEICAGTSGPLPISRSTWWI